MSEGKYLAFDPGTTTGMVIFDERGEGIRLAQFNLDELGEFLQNYADPITTVIVEEFKVYRHKTAAFANNKMEVSQAIGIIRDYARRRKCELVFQPAYIKSQAEKLTGHTVKGPHSNSHYQDAFLHGAFFLIRKGVRDSELVRAAKRERGELV